MVKVHTKSQKLRQHTWGLHSLHQVLWVYIGFQLSVFMGFLVSKQIGLWFVCLLLGSFCLSVDLARFQCVSFVLYYYNLLYCILQYCPLDDWLFSDERQNRSGSSWEGKWGGPGEIIGGGIIIRTYHVRKII